VTTINKGRWTAQPDENFVVFIIGMRINRWWMIHRWLPPIMAMRRMLRELGMGRGLGFYGSNTWLGRTILVVQYWRSFEQLEAYARTSDRSHVPAWVELNRTIGNDGSVGIYHETYRIAPGQFENVFINMPPMLLGNCATLIEARGQLATATGRMRSSANDEAPFDMSRDGEWMRDVTA
jgi:hypothetical protein